MPRLIALHKPYGVLSQFTPEAGHPSLAGFGLPPDVYPAGRLDHDSEGLLLLTDDGALAHRLLDPARGHERIYLAQVERIPAPEAIKALEAGILIQNLRTRPAKARLLESAPGFPPRNPPVRFRKNVPTAWIELRLREGRNRQVRRMTAAVGHPTLRLIRVAIGPLALGHLPPGEWRNLTPEEEQLLRASPAPRKAASNRR